MTEFSYNIPDIEIPNEDVFANSKKILYVRRHIAEHLQFAQRPVRVLEFGCGNGADLAQYILGNQIEYIGVDIHEPSLEYANQHFGSPHAIFAKNSPHDAIYDVVVFSEVLEHLPEPTSILERYVAQLSPNGIIIVSIPNGYGLTEIEKYVDRRLNLYRGLRAIFHMFRQLFSAASPHKTTAIPYNHDSGHIQFFTQKKIRAMASSAGLVFADFQNGSVMGADLTSVTILRWRTLVRLNTTLADYLPARFAATWHFVWRRKIE